MEKTLKEIRKSANMTQSEAADFFDVSLRSYKTYENDPEKMETVKYKFMLREMNEKAKIDEEHGLLTIGDISDICKNIFEKYQIEYCYLFGSYAKGIATEISDIDFLIAGDVSGLRYFGLVEELRVSLKKKIDVITLNQLKDNLQLTSEIFKYGMKIYG